MSYAKAMSPVPEIVDAARNGRMLILIDEERADAGGTLVVPGQMATPVALTFMAIHGRGIICLALAQQRVAELGLTPMAPRGAAISGEDFTVSIEAREGVTTGISAADRARTIAVAINSTNGAADIVTPGHVFPIAAREGGVLVRAAPAEAAVDIARLAGLNPSAALCRIMSEEGGVAQLDDLLAFGDRHDLPIGSIAELIAYRRRHDNLVERLAESNFQSRWGGVWRAMTFHNRGTGTEQIALVKGEIRPGTPTLVRMHALSGFGDVFGEEGPYSRVLERSMATIGENGHGVVVVIPMRGAFTHALRERSGQIPPDRPEFRDYGVGAQILAELGVEDIILLTNAHHTPVGLKAYGLAIVEERPIPG